MKALSTIILVFFSSLAIWAEAPASYYDRCVGKTGQALLSSLFDVIGPHTTVTYDGLWEVYKTSDVRPDGTVWDIYSTKAWIVGQEHCGNYKNVGDCINREHSFPKSWFSEASPMKSDAFHVYPTDGKVNGQRSNYPYGECSGGTQVASSGSVKPLGRLGTSTFPGYSGKVFEPDNQYKGDLARTYFYMAACYNNKISSWTSDMLAGNAYPAYKSWAVNLLLKWHREDPVSEKETDRNEAVWAHQRNRNPFIDHPELVEYIWGNKVGTAWTLTANEPEPVLTSPVDNSTVDLGTAATGHRRSVTIPVRGTAIKGNLSATVTGQGFSINPSSISADAINTSHAGIDVSYLSNSAGAATGTLRLTGNGVECNVKLTVNAISGLPASQATDITETSFTAHWTNIDDDGINYQLDVRLGAESLNGYPIYVPAEDEAWNVTGLEPGMTYTYTLSNSTLTSNTISVTTAEPIPSIQFLYDGDLTFNAEPNQPSEIAEILLDIDWIETDITISVMSPFALSTDKTSWATTCTLSPGEDRFYMRLGPATPGTYTTPLVAKAGEYTTDDIEIIGTVGTGLPTFIEDFEPSGKESYDAGAYNGSACEWTTSDLGWFSSDKGVDNSHCVRLGKTAASTLTTAQPKMGGIGTVSFHAMRWSATDGNLTIAVEHSPNGTSWTTDSIVTVDKDQFTRYDVPVNASGSQYLRLRQTTGKRARLDDLNVTDYIGAATPTFEYHTWDAYCRGRQLIIENSLTGVEFEVYSIDGQLRYNATLGPTTQAIDLAPGLYLVTSRGFTRRIVVK